MRFLLTDTKIPRDTRTLVAGVAERKDREPHVINGVLADIQRISDEAKRALSDAELARAAQLDILTVRIRLDCLNPRFGVLMRVPAQALITRNHDLLKSLGVSHPALEIIVAKTASTPYHLPTKLTGAGGGGCAVTLIPDGASYSVFRISSY